MFLDNILLIFFSVVFTGFCNFCLIISNGLMTEIKKKVKMCRYIYTGFVPLK